MGSPWMVIPELQSLAFGTIKYTCRCALLPP